MVQRGRTDSAYSTDASSDFKPHLYEGCNELGCHRVVSEHCGCRKGFCSIHISGHKEKTHRYKKKT